MKQNRRARGVARRRSNQFAAPGAGTGDVRAAVVRSSSANHQVRVAGGNAIAIKTPAAAIPPEDLRSGDKAEHPPVARGIANFGEQAQSRALPAAVHALDRAQVMPQAGDRDLRADRASPD